MSEFTEILYEEQGPMALITINRAAKHNAISLDTLEELHAALGLAARADAVRVITITGEGDRAFASGSDLLEVLHRDFAEALEPIVQGLAERLERTPKPTIAAINGICMGGGLEVALGCDLRIATPNARFATPEGKLGIIPGGGATARLPRIVGRGWGMEMLLMGEPIDAERALAAGLVSHVWPDGSVAEEGRALVDRIVAGAPLVNRWHKKFIRRLLEGGTISAEEGAEVHEAFETSDYREGRSAFLEKRAPRFRGA